MAFFVLNRTFFSLFHLSFTEKMVDEGDNIWAVEMAFLDPYKKKFSHALLHEGVINRNTNAKFNAILRSVERSILT
jgi:hypothetical protein